MEGRSRLETYLDKYARLFRVRTMFIYLFPLTLGFAAAAEGGGDAPGYKVALAFLAFLCGSFFSSTLNFYADVESDRLHNNMYKGDPHMSDQPFVTGEMGKLETVLVFLLTATGCVVLSLLAGREFAWFMIGSMALLGVLYSHPWFRFKNKPVLDIVTNATGACLLLIAGWKLLQTETWPPIWPLVYGFFFASTLYMPSVANDAPFDAAAGFRTSGVVFGAKRLLDAMIPLCLILIPVAMVNFIVDQSWLFKLFIALALPGALVFTAGMHLLYKPPFIRFNASLLVYPIALLWLFYFVYGLNTVLRR